MSEDEIEAIVDFLAYNPEAGDVIAGSGGARKVRHRGRGKGKSGGFRTIHYFYDGDAPVYLFTVFGKGERENLSRAEINDLHDLCKVIADAERSKR